VTTLRGTAAGAPADVVQDAEQGEATLGWAWLGLLGWRARPPARPAAAGCRWFLLAWLVALIVLAANHPGRMVFDTKLGVDINPAGFYAQLWQLWNPREWLGTLQDQYIGYAVPMAPFYLAGHLLHLPVWITERLWMSLLVAAGFWGLVRLATALGIGSDGSRLLAGAVFALWPTFTIVIGSTSAAVLPGLLAPWAVLPLVAAARGQPVISAAARSGAAVLCMGGVNAVSTIDVLILPALFILTHTAGRRRICVTLWWGAAVALATSWWAIPLLLQGRYSFNFLRYIEQAATTTRTASATAVLRGSGNWTAYFNLGQPWLSAGWQLVTTPAVILASSAAAAVGLYGLARRDMPSARWLRLSLGVAALGALAGYWGPLSGPFHAPVDNLLNGPLAPFRNVYKLEPVLAAGLALGLAHAMQLWWQQTIAVPDQPRRLFAGVTTIPFVAVVLGCLALPYLSGQILQPGSFTHVPGYWGQVADFLAARSAEQPALVVPADAHGSYIWGDPVDDPLEALARSPWVERSLVPYGGAGSQSFLGTAETAVESGEQIAGLTTYLQRGGIRYVVVRNDLDPSAIGYTAPQIVHRTLSLSGFRRVVAFGPLITGAQTDPQAPPQVQGLLPRYRAVEIYQAASPGQRAPGPAAMLPVSQTVLVNGGPDAILQLAGQGTLRAQPAIIAGDPSPAAPQRWAVTDGLRRADNAFGLVNSSTSYTYTAAERNPVDDPLGQGGGLPRQLLPVPARGHQTVAVLSGAATVTASSYGFWLAEMPQYDPVNAFDANPATAWTEGDPVTPVGQWLRISFGHAVTLPDSIGIRLLGDSSVRSIATRLEVSTAAGRVWDSVAQTNAAQPLQVPPGPTTWLRITITRARRVLPGGPGAGIRDVLIPGVRVTRYLQPPEDSAGPAAPLTTFSFHQQVPSPTTLASPAAYQPLARTFRLAGQESFRVRAAALALPGRELFSLLDRSAPARKSVLHVTASSTLGSLPLFGPANLFRAGRKAPWVAGAPNPVIHLNWSGDRRIAELRLRPDYGISAAPEVVKITSPNGGREARVGLDGVVRFRPLTTDRIDVSFPVVQSDNTVNPVTGQVAQLPVGLARLSVPALAGLHVSAPDPASRFSLPCGRGPAVTVDGRVYGTAVSGTIRDLTQFLPVRVRLCTRDGTLNLSPGRHRLTAAVPGLFTVTDVSLNGAAAPPAGLPLPAASAAFAGPLPATSAGQARSGAATGAQARALAVAAWQPETRVLRVGPGPASYLEVHQNFSPGWVATMGGRRLTAVQLDGWQQGFIVPAGGGGTIKLTFAPAGFYRIALVIAALGALALLIAAAWRPRIRPAPADDAGATAWTRYPSAGRLAWAWTWLGLLAVSILVLVAGGPVVIAVPVIAFLALRRSRWLPVLAAVAMVTAGVLAATPAQFTAIGQGAFGMPAQACALVALAAAIMPAVIRRRGQEGRP
jgi:arabinofuranan 3-O-arabinosyltransferase